MNPIEPRVKSLIFALGVSRKSEAEMQPNDYIQETLGLDSLSLIELIISVEEEFAITITDEEILEQDTWIKTLGSLTQFVSQKSVVMPVALAV